MRARAIAAEVVREVIAAPSDDPWSEALLLVYAQHGALIDGAAEVAGERLDGALAALGERPLGAALWGGLAGARGSGVDAGCMSSSPGSPAVERSRSAVGGSGEASSGAGGSRSMRSA